MLIAARQTLLLACTRVGRVRVATSAAVCCTAAGQTADAAARIEVERKFQAPDSGLTLAVLAAGGSLLGEKRFSDAYWDTPECELTRSDTWLRVRRMEADEEGQWELKLPVCAPALSPLPLRLQVAPPPRAHQDSAVRASFSAPYAAAGIRAFIRSPRALLEVWVLFGCGTGGASEDVFLLGYLCNRMFCWPGRWSRTPSDPGASAPSSQRSRARAL
jgi:hypothetical protein